MSELNIGTAHQYLRRIEKEEEEKSDQYWINYDLDLKNAEVRPILLSEAKAIIEEYEYLGCLAAVNWFQYGIFFKALEGVGEICGGVVVYGQEYAENRGVWDKYGYTGKIILLNRGVCLHWTPKNTNSRLIMESMKWLPEKYEVITCTIDPDAGEIGTIYQACNFHYVGAMRKNKTRTNFIINGKKYGSRSVRQTYGTMAKGKLPALVKAKLGDDATLEFVEVHAKHRYFYFRGNKKICRNHKIALKNIIKEYPKRKNITI
jgi:hypothetical protein